MATLTYRKRARKGVDHTTDGVVYVHHFGTGFQELVFTDHASAARFAAANGCERDDFNDEDPDEEHAGEGDAY